MNILDRHQQAADRQRHVKAGSVRTKELWQRIEQLQSRIEKMENKPPGFYERLKRKLLNR